MIEYHKIQSVYLRDPATKHRTFLIGQWAVPAFGYLANNLWQWTEKIDGTNVRVVYDGEKVRFGGRTDDAQMPVFLLERLQALFPVEKFDAAFPDVQDAFANHGLLGEVLLFGEGFGAKIQKGGGSYKPDGVDFILFDARVNGIYLARENVWDIGSKLGLRVAPIIGSGTLLEAIEVARGGYDSQVAAQPGFKAEGFVMRPGVELIDRMGHRIITKVKARDFINERVPA